MIFPLCVHLKHCPNDEQYGNESPLSPPTASALNPRNKSDLIVGVDFTFNSLTFELETIREVQYMQNRQLNTKRYGPSTGVDSLKTPAY